MLLSTSKNRADPVIIRSTTPATRHQEENIKYWFVVTLVVIQSTSLMTKGSLVLTSGNVLCKKTVTPRIFSNLCTVTMKLWFTNSLRKSCEDVADDFWRFLHHPPHHPLWISRRAWSEPAAFWMTVHNSCYWSGANCVNSGPVTPQVTEQLQACWLCTLSVCVCVCVCVCVRVRPVIHNHSPHNTYTNTHARTQ